MSHSVTFASSNFNPATNKETAFKELEHAFPGCKPSRWKYGLITVAAMLITTVALTALTALVVLATPGISMNAITIIGAAVGASLGKICIAWYKFGKLKWETAYLRNCRNQEIRNAGPMEELKKLCQSNELADLQEAERQLIQLAQRPRNESLFLSMVVYDLMDNLSSIPIVDRELSNDLKESLKKAGHYFLLYAFQMSNLRKKYRSMSDEDLGQNVSEISEIFGLHPPDMGVALVQDGLLSFLGKDRIFRILKHLLSHPLPMQDDHRKAFIDALAATLALLKVTPNDKFFSGLAAAANQGGNRRYLELLINRLQSPT